MRKEIYVLFTIFTLAEVITAQDSNECRTPNDEDGVCISVKKCEKLNNLLENRRHIVSVKILLQKSFCGYDGVNPKLCCPLEEQISQGSQGINQPIANTDPSNSLLLSSILPSNKTCGKIINNDNDDRIVGGRPSKLGAWPWMVAIGYKRPEKRSPIIHWGCGGSLITNRHVLTAAHCLVNLGGLKPTVARLGDLDLNPMVNDGASPIDYLIDGIITHERYLFGRKQINDIGLLKLKNVVSFNDHIQPICLPSKSDMNINYNKRPIVAGWGSTNPSQILDRVYPPNTKLMEVDLPLVHNGRCKMAYAEEKTAVIDNTVLCAGYLEGKKDSCRGDSGGPLMLAKQPQYYVMGIVSYGPTECGIPNKPGVYTLVPSFVDWIREKLVL